MNAYRLSDLYSFFFFAVVDVCCCPERNDWLSGQMWMFSLQLMMFWLPPSHTNDSYWHMYFWEINESRWGGGRSSRQFSRICSYVFTFIMNHLVARLLRIHRICKFHRTCIINLSDSKYWGRNSFHITHFPWKCDIFSNLYGNFSKFRRNPSKFYVLLLFHFLFQKILKNFPRPFSKQIWIENGIVNENWKS